MLDKDRNIIRPNLTKHYRLEKITFRKFRNLDGMEIDFGDKNVTGIFGANGLGKSSILSVIRCLYQAVYNPRIRKRTTPKIARPVGCENKAFGHLFYGNQYYNYNNSEIVAEFSYASKDSQTAIVSPLYEIKSPRKRWTPGTTSKPACPVYYINMETCVPVAEAGKKKSDREKRKRLYESILKQCSELKECFNKIFLHPIEISNTAASNINGVDDSVTVAINNKKLPFRELSAGEQRVLKLLNTIYKAEDNSIILIDEIEITLHPSALENLIDVLNKLAKNKGLQIIFTSHSLKLAERKDINVRTLYKLGNWVRCDHGYNQECRKLLEGKCAQSQIKMLVEDDVSKALMMELLRQNGKLPNVDLLLFGGFDKAFKLASSLHLVGELTNNIVFVLDGDVAITLEEKKKQVEDAHILENITDNEKEVIAKHFIQYNLPISKKIDSYIYELLVYEEDISNPIVNAAKSVIEYTMDTVPSGIKNAERDKRRFLEHYKIQDTATNLGYKDSDLNIGYQKIIEYVAARHCEEWTNLTKDIQDWINRNM